MTTWILHACFSLTMGMCSTVREYEYATEAQCNAQRHSLVVSVRSGYVICYPKKAKEKP